MVSISLILNKSQGPAFFAADGSAVGSVVAVAFGTGVNVAGTAVGVGATVAVRSMDVGDAGIAVDVAGNEVDVGTAVFVGAVVGAPHADNNRSAMVQYVVFI